MTMYEKLIMGYFIIGFFMAASISWYQRYISLERLDEMSESRGHTEKEKKYVLMIAFVGSFILFMLTWPISLAYKTKKSR